jgi:hypothetical protein
MDSHIRIMLNVSQESNRHAKAASFPLVDARALRPARCAGAIGGWAINRHVKAASSISNALLQLSHGQYVRHAF